MTRPTTEELARRALETVARAHGVPVSDVHAAVRRAAEHTEALGALTPAQRRFSRRYDKTGSRYGSRFLLLCARYGTSSSGVSAPRARDRRPGAWRARQ